MKTTRNQFLFDLGKGYDAEYRISKALPQMIKADTSEDLRRAILSHAADSQGHVSKVEQIFECFGHSVDENPKEGNPSANQSTSSVSNDAALKSALKLVEQGEAPPEGCQSESEADSYNTLNQWAKRLGNSEGADLLEQIIEEDQAAMRGDTDHFQMIQDRAM